MIMPLAAPVAGGVSTPQTFWVDDDRQPDANPGSEALPFKTITYALSQTDGDDTIMVKPGTYDTANGETFPLMVYGDTILSTHGPDVTIIDGGGLHRLMDCEQFTQGDTIDGFTFQNGVSYPAGGAMRVFLNWTDAPDAPIISNNIFREQRNDGIRRWSDRRVRDGRTPPYADQGQRVPHGNKANFSGGALIVSNHVAATVQDNLFADNEAEYGGAYFCNAIDETQTVVGNAFIENEATTYGGAVDMSLSSGAFHKITDNAFFGNTSGVDGGALWLYGGNFEVYRNDAGGNDAGDDGGFGYASFSSVESENNVIGGCTAVDSGAAWRIDSAALYLRNETIVDNVSPEEAVHAPSTDILNIDNSILWNPASFTDVRVRTVRVQLRVRFGPHGDRGHPQ